LENNVISLSGGKDSTAMLHMMIDRKIPIHSVIFFDTGWEFPQMYDHIDLVEKKTGLKIWKLHSRLSFEYWMFHRPIIARKGPMKGKIHRIGNGWPSSSRRWCTREKVETLRYFCKPIPNVVQCIGYAADEKRDVSDETFSYYLPLQEWGITEADALQYCYNLGYHWNGLYKIFKRVSCYCCPLQRIDKLRNLRKYYPELWKKMLEMDQTRPEHNRGFKGYKTVLDFEKRFAFEDKQSKLF
jgi:3'-phosphoadenosine 5'-phosphosulfate sulfotransferase (PAPS reductase)/FAD synthetase